jgi:hypothetical protein
MIYLNFAVTNFYYSKTERDCSLVKLKLIYLSKLKKVPEFEKF